MIYDRLALQGAYQMKKPYIPIEIEIHCVYCKDVITASSSTPTSPSELDEETDNRYVDVFDDLE